MLQKQIKEYCVGNGETAIELKIPVGARFVGAFIKTVSPWLFFEVDYFEEVEPKKESRFFQVCTTGQKVPATWVYMASFRLNTTALFHLYEVKK